ncbi:2-dehydro-3-deoxygluconokinase-like [Sycon ciliatum]|uniref:2-dehydro-3-deoxygluconokinase-like n=1 Tax=Sycon ciliatum TaxID=27933 RepID=UPI0031F706DE
MTERQRRVNSCSETFDVTTFGEAMLRYLPIERPSSASSKGYPSEVGEYFLRTVGGAEVNVSVALAQLGKPTSWASILPEGALGDKAVHEIKKAGVNMRWCQRTANMEMGTYYLLKDQPTPHYQRSNSAFSRMRTGTFDLFSIVSSTRWLHLTGITPMLGETPKATWLSFLEQAKALEVPVSIDLNHRPALSSLGELLYIVAPYLSSVELLILSSSTAVTIAKSKLSGWKELSDEEVLGDERLASRLREELKCKSLAISCSNHLDGNEQARWSTVASCKGSVSTYSTRTPSKLVEHLGGGDAWVAGFLHVILNTESSPSVSGIEDMGVLKKAAHRGDTLASLAQTKLGDFSSVRLDELEAEEARRCQ